MARASATISAFPSATIASARLGVAMSPTVRVAMPLCVFMVSANGTFMLATRLGRASELTPPEDTQTKSTPTLLRAPANTAASAAVSPPSIQSWPVMRAPSGMPCGIAARTALATSSGKRMRPSKEPPYSSLRLLEIGERKLCSRYPCAACSSTASTPARTARWAAWTNPSRTRSISAATMARGMGELNADFRIPVAPTMGQDLPERCFAVVGIKPEAAVGDPPTPLGPGGLHHDQSCARIRQRAEMGEVPAGRDPVIGTVLAHRGDDDPVHKVKPGEADRGEQGTGHEWRAHSQRKGTRFMP